MNLPVYIFPKMSSHGIMIMEMALFYAFWCECDRKG